MCLIRVISTLCRAVALQELSLTPLVYPIFASLPLLKSNFYSEYILNELLFTFTWVYF